MSKWHDKYHNYDDEDDWDGEEDDDNDDDDDFDEYGRWDYYHENRPRKVANGLKTKSDRGAIGETWWSKR
ncbi:MAG TPA: hypothetical protein VKR42_06035, partial [Ktedonobacteraceae bacterium]|nr:hypothetical protein [Ktedonobacteraceae bacterium]